MQLHSKSGVSLVIYPLRLRRIPFMSGRSHCRFLARASWLILTALCIRLGASAPGDAPAPPGPPPADKPRPAEGNALTPEERERVRKVFAQIWEDPEVVATREAVHQATVRHRKAIRAAVEKQDPLVVPLLDKMHRHIELAAGKYREGGPGGKRQGTPPAPLPSDPAQALEQLLSHEPGFDAPDPAVRKRLMDLAQQVAKEKEFEELLASLIQVTQPSEVYRSRRQFREKLLRAMAARDPSVEEVLKRPAGKDRTRTESAPSGAPPPP